VLASVIVPTAASSVPCCLILPSESSSSWVISLMPIHSSIAPPTSFRYGTVSRKFTMPQKMISITMAPRLPYMMAGRR